FTWLMTVAGLLLLWRAVKERTVPLSNWTLAGGLALGWGLFNLVEGVIDHHILHIHHVIEGAPHAWYDVGFLASGIVLCALGWTWLDFGRRAGRESAAMTSPALRNQPTGH